MSAQQFSCGSQWFLPREELDALVQRLTAGGYTVLAPVVRDGAVCLGPVTQSGQIAAGVTDRQGRGSYELADAEPDLVFQYAAAMDGPRRFFFPPSQRLFQLHVEKDRLVPDSPPPQPPRLAFLGIRPCDLAAIGILDRVLGGGGCPGYRGDPYYTAARREALLLVVNCTRPGGNCFCVSTRSGPTAGPGHDLALTELRAGFVIQVGSERGGALLQSVQVRAPSSAELELAGVRLEQARERMGRSVDMQALADHLERHVEHPRYADTAARCLSCGNCTMICPTCFCSSIVDGSDLTATHGQDHQQRRVARRRIWDSCFTGQFSYTTAGPVRSTVRSRYRHWIRHKLCTFNEQFGVSGCVGCGRCITWCPGKIDVLEEAAAINGQSLSPPARPVIFESEMSS